jgi:DNA-binding Xre family transcriptional regulator
MALCDIFGCTPNELIEPAAAPAAAKKNAAAGGAASA